MTETVSVGQVTDGEFRLFQKIFHERFGLNLSDQKKLLLSGRLGRRIEDLGLPNFRAYFERISSDPDEFQVAINRITTNETYFFREGHQFELLRSDVLSEASSGKLKIWSAACSTGEEPYSIAMVMRDVLGDSGWEILATDISTRVLDVARKGLYPMERASGIPVPLLKTFCLRGQGEFDGKLLVGKAIREAVEFRQLNLLQIPQSLGEFDVVFLRNAIIYFDGPTKEQVLKTVCTHLRKGGWLFLGHSESLAGMDLPVSQVKPSIYRRE